MLEVQMSLQKQARALNEKQLKNALARTSQYRNGLRNRCIIELTCFAGLRAKEVTGLRWEHVLDNDGKPVLVDNIRTINVRIYETRQLKSSQI